VVRLGLSSVLCAPNRPETPRAGRRLTGVLVFVAVLTGYILGASGSTSAVQPVIRHYQLNEAQLFPSGTLCDFPVVVGTTGKVREAAYFNKDGSLRWEVSNPSLVNTLSNSASGKSLTSPDRGMDRVTYHPDGTFTIFGTGIHFRIKGVLYLIGRWLLTFDGATGELLSADYSGNFDVGADEALAVVCAQLA
jgi:hypothetical protein